MRDFRPGDIAKAGGVLSVPPREEVFPSRLPSGALLSPAHWGLIEAGGWGWDGILGGRRLGQDLSVSPWAFRELLSEAVPWGASHPLPALALGPQVGRAFLESPRVLGFVVHLGGAEEERDAIEDPCQRNTQGRGERAVVGQGWEQNLRTPMGHTRGIHLPCPLAPWAWGAAIMKFILTQAWKQCRALPLCVLIVCLLGDMCTHGPIVSASIVSLVGVP